MTDLELIEAVQAESRKHARFLALAGQTKSAYMAGAEHAAGIAARILREQGAFRRVMTKDTAGKRFWRFTTQ